jgi:hypothetical protein
MIVIIIIVAITVIGTMIIQTEGVTDQVALLVIRVMEARVIPVTETTAEVILLVGFQKVLFFVMAIPSFVSQALLLVR